MAQAYHRRIDQDTSVSLVDNPRWAKEIVTTLVTRRKPFVVEPLDNGMWRITISSDDNELPHLIGKWSDA